MDAKSIACDRWVLVARTPTRVLGWVFAAKEDEEAYTRLIRHIYGVGIFVTDGHKAARAAIRKLHPLALIQRCVVHVQRFARMFLTQSPKTDAGRKLLEMINSLTPIHSRGEKRRWIRRYQAWRRKSAAFLAEKTHYLKEGKRRWWYTHKNLRRVRTHLDNAITHLFRFVAHEDQVPRNTNHIEGGLNSRMQELLERHRGLSVKNKKRLISLFLQGKCDQKPTRNDH